jgi:hypothetical protein
MSLLFMDGFDYYETADLTHTWDSVFDDVNGNPPTLTSGTGRYGSGSQALYLGPNGGAGVTKGFGSQDTWYVGFAFKYSATVNVGRILSFPGPSGIDQVVVSLNAGILTVGNTNFSVVSATSITAGTWNYIEVLVSGLVATNTCAAGSIQLRINGIVVCSVPANQHTQGDFDSSGSTATSTLLIGGGSSTSPVDIYIDDLYVCNEVGTINNNFLGDVRIECLTVTGAGSNTQWTPLSGTNYSNIDEVDEDGDTSYNSTNVITQVDTFPVSSLSSTYVTINAVQISITARKDNIGLRSITAALKSGSTTYDHSLSNNFGLGDGYAEFLDTWQVNPNGNVAWTNDSINEMEIGVKLTG